MFRTPEERLDASDELVEVEWLDQVVGGAHPQQLVGEVDLLPAEAARVGEGAAQEGKELLLRKRLEDKDLAAGEQRRVDLEGGVFRGGAHERDGSVFHVWQEAVLLGAVEPVDFIHEEEGSLAVFPPFGGLVKGFPQIRHAREDGGERDEVHGRARSQDARQRGFSAAGRPPQDEAGQLAGIRHEPDGPSLPQQVVLAHDFLQGGRSQAVRQGPVREGGKQARRVVFFHAHHHTPREKGFWPGSSAVSFWSGG